MKRLGIDYVDLYIIGGVNPEVSIGEMAEGLLNLKKKGAAKNIGVSNYRLKELELISKYTDKQIMYEEMQYNLAIREVEKNGILEYCRANGIILSAYRPLQMGQLANSGVELLDKMSAKYGKSQAQISLKWLVSKKGVVAIVKAVTPKHIDEDFDIFDWDIEKEDLVKLDKKFPIQMGISDCSYPKQVKP